MGDYTKSEETLLVGKSISKKLFLCFVSCSFSLCNKRHLQSVSRVTAASGYTAHSNGEKTKCCQKRAKGSLSGLVFVYHSPKLQIRAHDYSLRLKARAARFAVHFLLHYNLPGGKSWLWEVKLGI